jgi:hypothetical protein
MTQVIYSVFPVQAGWAVQLQPDGHPLVFFSGGRAEAAARALCKASGSSGVTAEVRVHSRDGEFVGGWRYDDGRRTRIDAGAAPAA